MNNTSDHSQEDFQALSSEVLRILTDVFNVFPIRYYLIGGQARDIHFSRKGIVPLRVTRDIDFAVMVESMEQYDRIISELLSSGFRKAGEPYRLIWKKDGTIIDLLPFGEIEKEHLVKFIGHDVELNMMGFYDIADEVRTFPVQEGGTLSVPLPPLHGLFILKLLSWNDKSSEREKDLEDLILILDYYWEFVEEEAYALHLDLFGEDDFDIHRAAARILGRHLRDIPSRSSDLKRIVVDILEREVLRKYPPGRMIVKFAEMKHISVDKVLGILQEILKGINDE